MAANEYKNEGEKTGRFQWFVLVILIPLIFAVMLSLIVATIAGVNVFEAAQKYSSQIPVVSSIIPDQDEKERSEAGSPELKAELEDKKAEIQSLQTELTTKDQTIEELNSKITDLTNQLATKNESKQQRDEILKKVSISFKEMDPEEAAPIIANLDQNVAISVLENLPDKERGLIFAEMNPEQAANLTSAFVQSTNASEAPEQSEPE